MNADIFTQSVALGNINPTGIVSPKFGGVGGGIIDPKNVLNDLRVSISPGALMYQTKGKACKEETNFMYICEEEKKERTRSANCKTETEYKFML